MSTSYYLYKKDAKQEYEKIKKYWEEEFVDAAKGMIIKKCEEINGEFINRDYAKEKLLSDYHFISNFFPDYDIPTESEIGQFSSVNQRFDYCLIPGEIRIHNLKELERFINNNPDYCIYDECGDAFTIEQFKKKTKQ